MPEQSNDYRVVVFGAGGVGKSSLVLRFVKGTFRESYIPTVEDTYRQVSHAVTLKSFYHWSEFRSSTDEPGDGRKEEGRESLLTRGLHLSGRSRAKIHIQFYQAGQ